MSYRSLHKAENILFGTHAHFGTINQNCPEVLRGRSPGWLLISA